MVCVLDRIFIFCLLMIIFWMSVNLVRLENYHYGTQVGFCNSVRLVEKDQCLSDTKTRTNYIWTLLYALRIL